MDATAPQQQPTSDTLARKCFDAKWYGRDNPFYYIYPTLPDSSKRTKESQELYRSFTGIWLNRSTIYFIGEAHLGPTRLLDFHRNDEPLTIIMEAGNKLYREATTVMGLWLREPYFAYYYKRNQLTDCMKNDRLKEIVDQSVPYKENFNFIPIDYRESIMDCPLFAPYIAMVWILAGDRRRADNTVDLRVDSYGSFIPKSLNLTIDDLRASKYYNEALPESFYADVLQRYNYSDLTQFKENINRISELTAIEFFNQVTFHAFDEQLNRYDGKYVRAYFEQYKPPGLSAYYCAVDDIICCIEIFEALDRGDKTIIVYTGGGHTTAMLMWLSTVFHDRIIKSSFRRDDPDTINHIIDAMEGL